MIIQTELHQELPTIKGFLLLETPKAKTVTSAQMELHKDLFWQELLQTMVLVLQLQVRTKYQVDNQAHQSLSYQDMFGPSSSMEKAEYYGQWHQLQRLHR